MTDVLDKSPAGRKYGCYRDNPHSPARRLLALKHDTSVILPPRATTSQHMGPVRDQGEEGSCTGQMGAAMLDLAYRRDYAVLKGKPVAPDKFMASASFIYKNNLLADGMLGMDVGSSIHQTVMTLNQKGSCVETVAPYSDTDYSSVPTSAQYINAIIYKMGAYHSLTDLYSMRACIASGHSFGAGIDVYSSFEEDWEQPGMMPMPNTKREQLLGGHAQHFMDYDDTVQFPDGSKGGFLVQNSWGSSFGISAPGRSDGGCYWLPYAFVDAGLMNDAWIIHWGKAWK